MPSGFNSFQVHKFGLVQNPARKPPLFEPLYDLIISAMFFTLSYSVKAIVKYYDIVKPEIFYTVVDLIDHTFVP